MSSPPPIDRETLFTYLSETPEIITLHRQRIIPSPDFSFSDEIRSASIPGESAPLSLSAMELADNEARAFGDLLYYLVRDMRIIPPCTLKGYWKSYGVILGIRPSGTSYIEEQAKHLIKYIDDIIDHGYEIEDLLQTCYEVRRISHRIYPQSHDADDLLTPREIAEKTGRGLSTVYSWLADGQVQSFPCEGLETLYSFSSLQAYLALKDIKCD